MIENIDIRFAIADEDYDHLWKVEQTLLLAGLGDYLLLETAFVRALTADGLLVEAAAMPMSKTDGLTLYEWCLVGYPWPPAVRCNPRLDQRVLDL